MIYLDNAAATRVCPEAAQAALRAMTEAYGNPSSTHAPGRSARAALTGARGAIARSLGAEPGEIFFTSGGTEGDNWALISGAERMRRQGGHILSSQAEHDAVRKTLDALEARGFTVTRLRPGPDGAVSADAVREALREDTILVSLMLVNNETGAVTDIPAVASVLKETGSRALLHTDAVQGYLKLPLRVKTLGADLITLSGHKIHAPKGVGALYVRKGLKLGPLLRGGGQEEGLRSGTENLPGILAFAAAAEAFLADTDARARMDSLRALAADTLRGELGAVVIGGGAPHILSVSLPGYRAEMLLNALDGLGICVSMGSACKRGGRSHVLTAMGLPPKIVDGALRISLGRFNTREDITALCAALADIRARRFGAL